MWQVVVQAPQAPGLNVTDRLHRRDHEAQQQRDESWRVEADVEGGGPACIGKQGTYRESLLSPLV